jgi:hypothetical protein
LLFNQFLTVTHWLPVPFHATPLPASDISIIHTKNREIDVYAVSRPGPIRSTNSSLIWNLIVGQELPIPVDNSLLPSNNTIINAKSREESKRTISPIQGRIRSGDPFLIWDLDDIYQPP